MYIYTHAHTHTHTHVLSNAHAPMHKTCNKLPTNKRAQCSPSGAYIASGDVGGVVKVYIYISLPLSVARALSLAVCLFSLSSLSLLSLLALTSRAGTLGNTLNTQ